MGTALLLSTFICSTSFAANKGFLNGKPFEYLNNMIELNEADIAALEALTTQLALDIEQNNLDISMLEENVVLNTTSIFDIQSQIDEFEANLSATQQDVETLFADLGLLEARHRLDLSHLLNLIRTQRVEIARLRNQVRTAVVQLGQQIKEVEEAADLNSGNINNLLVTSSSNMADILAMNAILDDHESRLVGAESSINILVGSIADIQIQLSNVEYRLSGAQTDIDDLQALHTTTFSGVHQNIPQSSLTGWSECFSEGFGHSNTPISAVISACNKANIMVACRVTGSPILSVAAYASRADVLFDVGTGRASKHTANEVDWYYSGQYSWGFAPAGQGVSRNSCDTNNRTSNDRICHHTRNNNLNGGWRCGNATSLNGNNRYERVFLTAD